MKKLSLVLTLVMTLLLAGCGTSYNSIERDFEKEGYQYSENSTYVAFLLTQFETEQTDVIVYSFTNGDDAIAVLIEFLDEDEIEPSFYANPFLKGYIDEGYEIEELQKDNFVILPLTVSDVRAQEMIDIFQGN